MKPSLFDVVYIDKFRDPNDVVVFNRKAKERFKLSDGALYRLGAGDPIVIKRRQQLEKARRFRLAIEGIGGICWYQPAAADGRFHDRRQSPRRGTLDRRSTIRCNGAPSDRRYGPGRRTSDRA